MTFGNEERSLFNKWYWSNWTPNNININFNVTLYTKSNSKWIVDLNVRHTTIKL